mmetsp:Transcript_16307/g.54615  ORF Transcript_16307/g.54615 Transcript_16307/m.54615 type:complete len:547 (-) Transcript_16307:90-1730(-)
MVSVLAVEKAVARAAHVMVLFVMVLFVMPLSLASCSARHRSMPTNACGDLTGTSALRIQRVDGQESMMAVRNIHRGEMILSIPYRCVMSADNIPHEHMGSMTTRVEEFVRREFEDWPRGFALNAEELALLTYFTSELAKGNSSSFSFYFSTLPSQDQLDSIIYWGEEDGAMLRATGLEQLRTEVVGRLRRLLDSVQRLMPQALPRTVSQEFFLRCWALFISRFFNVPLSPSSRHPPPYPMTRSSLLGGIPVPLGGRSQHSLHTNTSFDSNPALARSDCLLRQTSQQPAVEKTCSCWPHRSLRTSRPMLVPYLDKVNHCREAKGVWVLEQPDGEDFSVRLYAGRSFLAGQQVCHAYTWSMTAEEFLFRYGIFDDQLYAAGWISFAQEEQIFGPALKEKLSLLAGITGATVFQEIARQPGDWLGHKNDLARSRVLCRLRAHVASLDVMAASCRNGSSPCCIAALDDEQLEARAWLSLRALCLQNVNMTRAQLGELWKEKREQRAGRQLTRLRSIALLGKMQMRKLLQVAAMARSHAMRLIGLEIPTSQ